MESSAKQGESEKDLLAILVAAQIISEAQAELARFDSNERGMTLEEVLLARRWVSEEQLKDHAPWLFNKSSAELNERITGQLGSLPRNSTQTKITDSHGSSDDYGANLARYRSIMRDILE